MCGLKLEAVHSTCTILQPEGEHCRCNCYPHSQAFYTSSFDRLQYAKSALLHTVNDQNWRCRSKAWERGCTAHLLVLVCQTSESDDWCLNARPICVFVTFLRVDRNGCSCTRSTWSKVQLTTQITIPPHTHTHTHTLVHTHTYTHTHTHTPGLHCSWQ